jgi:hypothetical protein
MGRPPRLHAIHPAEKNSKLAHTGDRALYSHEEVTPAWGSREERAVAYPLRAPGRGERGYAGGALPTWLHLDRSDPDVLPLLLPATDSIVSCFSSRDATQQPVERKAREDHRERSQPTLGEVASKRRHSCMEYLPRTDFPAIPHPPS